MSEHPDIPEPIDQTERPSKSALKRESHALQALGEKLVTLRPEQLARLELPERLRDAVLLAQSIRQRGALRRQLQFIGRLMRSVDAAPILAALQTIEGQSREATARLHRLERWRERLLAEDAEALTELLTAYPKADVQRVRQWVRNARQERERQKPPRSARALFQYLSELMQ